MKELSVRDTCVALSRIEEILEREGEIVVTRHGKPVARIVPARPAELPTHAQLRASLPVLPSAVRTLEGIQLSVALTLAPDRFGTADRRLAAAARTLGLRVVGPDDL